MSGLGGLNKSPNGVVLGLVQLQLPVVETPGDLAAQTQKICAMVAKARRNMPGMDLVVFPEYALHGLSMDTNPDIMCRSTGRKWRPSSVPAPRTRSGAASRIMEHNPHGNPYNSGIIIDDQGELQLYYRKLHPWVPVEPWEPGDLGIPVCDGPERLEDRAHHLPRRHVPGDGARGRLQGRRDHDPHRRLHRADPPRLEGHQPGQRVLQPDVHRERLHVRLATAPSIPWARACSSTSTARRWSRAATVPTRSSPASCAPISCARRARVWGVENNIYQFGHRGYVAVKGGARDCPYTYMQDLVAGTLPPALGERGRGDGRHVVRLPGADARLSVQPDPETRKYA